MGSELKNKSKLQNCHERNKVENRGRYSYRKYTRTVYISILYRMANLIFRDLGYWSRTLLLRKNTSADKITTRGEKLYVQIHTSCCSLLFIRICRLFYRYYMSIWMYKAERHTYLKCSFVELVSNKILSASVQRITWLLQYYIISRSELELKNIKLCTKRFKKCTKFNFCFKYQFCFY